MKVRDVVSEDNKKFFAYLMLTCKNVSLYPEGHSISINSIRQFHQALEAHILQYGDIRIEVEKDRVLCQGVEVQKGSPEEGTLPFTLFRDGIRWLEFARGITLDEIQDLLFIIHRYSVLAKEPEGDIVTAFWEAHFEHVMYEADDLFSGQDPEQIDSLSRLDTLKPSEEKEAETTDDVFSAAESSIDKTSSGGLAIDPAYFVLTPEEKTELQNMVSREEMLSSSEHLNMLLDMLLQFQQEKDFNIVLSVLAEEFEGAYGRRDFEDALIILNGIRKILDSGRLNDPAIVALIESFYKEISSDSKCLNPLEEIWSALNIQQMEHLNLIFRHLTPRSVPTLIRFLLIGQPSQLEKIVVDVIVSLASQDINCLESLINTATDRSAEKLVHVLSRLEGNASMKYLLRLARHSSASVRRMAVKALGQICGNHVSVLFEFIDDPDTGVQRLILSHMAQSKNETAEDLLVKYLQRPDVKNAPPEHIVDCFKTLGYCGSARSVPFLRKTLLHRKWLAGLKKSPYREGAAVALVFLDIPEAKDVFEEASKSFHPGLRRIARNTEREFTLKKRGGL